MNPSSDGISRRRFLLEGAAVLGLALTPPGVWGLVRDAPQDVAHQASGRLVRLFPDRAEVAPLGRRYLEDRAHRLRHGELLAELLPPDVDARGVLDATDAELREALAEWMERDLVAGRIEEVDGWLLSQTGVRLAALTVLWPG